MSIRTLHLALFASLALAGGCQVEKTQDGELPDIDVEGGQLPKFEVKPNEIDARDDTDDSTDTRLQLRMDTTTIVVPKLERVPDTIR